MRERIVALLFFMGVLASAPVRAEDYDGDDLSNAKLESEMEYTQADELMAQKIQAEDETKNLRQDIQSEKQKFAATKRSNERLKDQIHSQMLVLRKEQVKLSELKKQSSKELAVFDKKSHELNNLKSKVATVREEKSQTQQKLADTKQQLRDVEKEIRSLEREKKRSQAAISKWKSERKRLEGKKSKRLAHARKLNKEVTKLQRQEERSREYAVNH